MPAHVFVTDVAYHEDRVAGLIGAHEAGVPGALAQVRAWLPEQGDAPLAPEAARLVHARQHGFPGWPAFVAQLGALAAGETSDPFLEAFASMEAQRWGSLSSVLRDHPEVMRSRGTNGNTLLNLAVSLAGRSCAPLPAEALEVLELLLHSSDVDEANDRGWAPLHQAAYANRVPVVERLLRAGARADGEAYGAGGTPLAVALFWGHRAAADVLAEAGVLPRNLRIASGLGRLDLLRACFAQDGSLTAAAGEGRGFYRPHTGFPSWTPSDRRQEILDEGLVWAAKADRVGVLPELVARGADVNADPYRGTPLGWAAANGRLSAARWLLEHGAEVNRKGTFGGPGHGQEITALHLAAQNDHVEMVRLLLGHGADRTCEDALYHATPTGWAEHCGATLAREVLAGETA